MSQRYVLLLCIYAIVFSPIILHAQEKATKTASLKDDTFNKRLFEGDDILHFKLTGKLNSLFNDRSENNSYHPLLLQYMQKDSNVVSVQVVSKTRGHFRRMKSNCYMPPLLLQFPKEQNKNSVFKKQDKLKLVVPCRGDDYVINEWLVYKLYNLISDRSFNAKLVQVDFEDSANQRKTETHYCILLEDEKKMAERNGTYIWKRKMLNMKNINVEEFKKMAVFQYLIGNTDWGIPYLQNIVLLEKDSMSLPYAVPYDFDHAGIVDASYAAPAPELELTSTRQRMYRGYCENDMKSFASTFELFNKLKPQIYDLYTNCSLLNARYVKFVKNFLDDFYSTINSSRKCENEFGKPCTVDQRIEIRGLKN